MDVSKNSGTPKSSILIGFSIIFTIPFWVFSPYFWKHPYIKIIKFGDLASGKKQPTFCRRLYAPPRGSLESTSWMFLSDLPERFQGHVFKQPLVSSWLGMWIFVCFFAKNQGHQNELPGGFVFSDGWFFTGYLF